MTAVGRCDPQSYPPELVSAAAREASAGADRVSVFLRTLGIAPEGPSSERVVKLPARFLLCLDAALHLLIWEHRGIDVHRTAGLPSANEALRKAFRLLDESRDPDPSIERLGVQVLALFAERMAWHGRPELEADIVLGEIDEDELVDALADLIWEHRDMIPANRH